MVMILEQSIVDEIARIGELRKPSEACGLLLPHPVNGRQVIEVPNRAKMPHDSFEMTGSDLTMALQAVIGPCIPDDLIPKLTAWHTHPGGNVGPSVADMRNKPERLKSLVVTIFEDKAPVATWF